MITLVFLAQREPIKITIDNKVITYFDRKWTNGITFMPKNPELVHNLLLNQRRFPMAQQIVAWIQESNSGSSLVEYEAAATDEAVAEIVKREALSKGLVESK